MASLGTNELKLSEQRHYTSARQDKINRIDVHRLAAEKLPEKSNISRLYTSVVL